MTYEEIMAWGEKHHWPYLSFGKISHLRHGKRNYEQLQHSPTRLKRAAKRIAQWNALVASCHVENSSTIVDKAEVQV